MSRSYDIVIAGGGVVGCAAALALSQLKKYKIAVIENRAPEQSNVHPSFDARVIALAKASLTHLSDWQFDIESIDSQPITDIHVSDRKHIGQCLLNANEIGVDALGKVVRLEQLGYALYQQLLNTQHTVDYFTPERIERLERQQDAITLHTNKQSLSAKLLVIAEGASSSTAAMCGFKSTEQDYQQSAIITNISTQLAHNNCAFERFTKYGPIALLPMSEGAGNKRANKGIGHSSAEHLMSLVWTCHRDEADKLMALDKAVFLQRLETLFGTRLGRLEDCSERYAYPLTLKRQKHYTSHRVACIGNAAQSLHPIAGQGFNLGVRDIQGLVDSIEQSTQPDPGHFHVLQSYKRMRAADKDATINATDTLVRVFSNQYLPFVISRNAGLMLLNKMDSFKSQFARFAMGER